MPSFGEVIDLVARSGIDYEVNNYGDTPDEIDHIVETVQTLQFDRDDASFQLQHIGDLSSLRCSRVLTEPHDFAWLDYVAFFDYLTKETGIRYDSGEAGEISCELTLPLSSKTGLIGSSFTAQDIKKILDDSDEDAEAYTLISDDGVEHRVEKAVILWFRQEYTGLDHRRLARVRLENEFWFLVDYLALVTREAANVAKQVRAYWPSAHREELLKLQTKMGGRGQLLGKKSEFAELLGWLPVASDAEIPKYTGRRKKT